MKRNWITTEYGTYGRCPMFNRMRVIAVAVQCTLERTVSLAANTCITCIKQGQMVPYNIMASHSRIFKDLTI